MGAERTLMNVSLYMHADVAYADMSHAVVVIQDECVQFLNRKANNEIWWFYFLQLAHLRYTSLRSD